MQKFQDTSGVEYTLSVTVASIERVRTEANVDLAKLFEEDGSILQALFDDPVKLVHVLFVLAKPTNVSPGQFAESLAGDELETAGNALVEAVVDFFPRAQRQSLRKMLAKLKTAAATYREKAEPILEAQIDEKFNELLADLTRSKSVTGSPESSDSIQHASPSANSSG